MLLKFPAIFILVGLFTFAFAGSITEKFKVYGNCGMCESRIEKAVLAIDGVTSADWNKETKMMEVNFDGNKTDLERIQKAIADAGHDTEKYSASDKKYNELPGCCHYERKSIKEDK